MSRRKLEDKNIRKVFKSGSSYALTLPIEVVRDLKIRKGQKMIVKMRREKNIIEDWK